METFGSLAAVIAAVEEDGRAELDRLQAEGAAAARIAEQEAAKPGRADAAIEELVRRLEEALRTAAAAEAEQAWLDRRAELEDREAWFEEVAEEAVAQVGAALTPLVLERWAAEALQAMGSDEAEVRLAPEDARALSAETRARLHVVEDLTLPRGSCVARTLDGGLRFDNGVRARAERTRTGWRARLGEVYPG